MKADDMECFICSRIDDIKNGKNEFFVRELKTGYVVLADFQFYKGYSFFLSKTHTAELHDLGTSRTKFLEEMATVAEAVYKAFRPKKLNYELLGNTDRHLHWHLIPRYENDPNPNSPIWVIDKNIRCAESAKPSKEELKLLKNRFNFLLQEL